MQLILNLGCGNDTYGSHRVDKVETAATTHVFNVESGFQFSNDFFDEVYSRNLLEHMRNPGFFLAECHRVLKPGGKIRLITDNAECQRYYYLGTHTGRYEKKHPGDHHYCIFTVNHLRNHMLAAGFRLLHFKYKKTDTRGRFLDVITREKPRIEVEAFK